MVSRLIQRIRISRRSSPLRNVSLRMPHKTSSLIQDELGVSLDLLHLGRQKVELGRPGVLAARVSNSVEERTLLVSSHLASALSSIFLNGLLSLSEL